MRVHRRGGICGSLAKGRIHRSCERFGVHLCEGTDMSSCPAMYTLILIAILSLLIAWMYFCGGPRFSALATPDRIIDPPYLLGFMRQSVRPSALATLGRNINLPYLLGFMRSRSGLVPGATQ